MELDTATQLITVAGRRVPYLLCGDDRTIWFQAKPLAELLDYSDTAQAIRTNIRQAHRQEYRALLQGYGPAKVLSGAGPPGCAPCWQPASVFVNIHGLVDFMQKANRADSHHFLDWMTRQAVHDGPDAFLAEFGSTVVPMTMEVSGMLYVVTSPLLAAVKIGRWSGTLEALASRYRTTFGTQLELHTTPTSDCHAAEATLLEALSAHNISGELFEKSDIDHYITEMRRVCQSTPARRSTSKRRASSWPVWRPEKRHEADDEASCFRTASEIYKDVSGEMSDKEAMMWFGRELAKEYRDHHDGQEPRRMEKMIDGTMRRVIAYSTDDNPWIVSFVRDCMTGV